MKKSILLLTAGLIAGVSVNAQQVLKSNVEPSEHPVQAHRLDNHFRSTSDRGARTTASPTRWYLFNAEYLDMYAPTVSKSVSYISPVMWNDTTALFGYTGTVTGPYAPYQHNQLISVGMGLDPMASFWNYADGSGSTSYPLDYTGEMGIRPTDAYTIDSLFIVGWYTRSSITTTAKTSVVDTLIVTLTQGNGSASSPITSATMTTSTTLITAYCPTCVSLTYSEIFHDTINNRAGGFNGTPITATNAVYKFLLNSSDTNALAPKNAVFPRPGHGDVAISYPVSAGNAVAATVTFKSGDPAYGPTGPHPGDTIRTSDGTSILVRKYNVWSPQVEYLATASTSGSPAAFCSGCYLEMGRASGHFAIEGGGWQYHDTRYTPNWNIISGSATAPTPNGHQFPNIGFHVNCTSCLNLPITSLGVNEAKSASVATMPNPADNNLVINYNGAFKSDATVTLTNVMGQVVATQQMVDGKAVFNTADLASGHYIFTVTAKNDRATGRVVIAH